MILHCLRRKTWEVAKNQAYYGAPLVASEGFIHCSPVELFWRVASTFKNVSDELVLLCIDPDRLEAELRWEDGDGCGRFYPHIYGPLNLDAVTAVLPYLKDAQGGWLKNAALCDIPDQ